MPAGMTPEYREAVRRLRARKRFVLHAWIYAVCMLGLAAANAWFWDGYAWALWPGLAWGVGLIFHAVSAWSRRGDRRTEETIRNILHTLKQA
jgi:hypothetical protein